jgi:hypothetical protein
VASKVTNPGPVEKRRRRDFAIVGELLARLQSDAAGARLAFRHIGAEPGAFRGRWK